MLPAAATGKILSREFLDVLIQAAWIAVSAIACLTLFPPFLDLFVWSPILAITLTRSRCGSPAATCNGPPLWLLPGAALQRQQSESMPMRRG